jgi:hypothetical protein
LLWFYIFPDPFQDGGEAEHTHEGRGAPFLQARPQTSRYINDTKGGFLNDLAVGQDWPIRST